MATHRVIEKAAGTGERTCSLSPLEFRVWVQYLLSADDYGICPAEAIKLQADCPALQRESAKRVQAALERLVTVQLCGVFTDGRRRYLYQADWQDFQRIKHPTRTALPPPPDDILEKCSAKTAELFRQNHPKLSAEVGPHGNATATATADATANAKAPTAVPASPRQPVQGTGAFEAGTLPRDHMRHGYCGPGYRLCLNQWEFTELVKQFGGNDPQAARSAIEAFVGELVAALGADQSPGGFKAIEQEFQVYLRKTGRLSTGSRLSVVPTGPTKAERDHDARLASMEGR